MAKGWRILFYSLIALAVLSIAYITIRFIIIERRIKATGDPDPEVRRRAAARIIGDDLPQLGEERKPITFLAGQPQTVRDNVVWSLEQRVHDDAEADNAIAWIVDIATDLSGPPPVGEPETDAARLAVLRLGEQAVEPLLARLSEHTEKTLLKDQFANRRAVAAYLLGQLGAEQAVQPLIDALRDEYVSVRESAAAALAVLGTPEAEAALEAYLYPLLAVLDGRYVCYARLDSEGRIRNIAGGRERLLYGPFEIIVTPTQAATEADLQRQRDSAAAILEKEAARREVTKQALEEGRKGRVVRPTQGAIGLEIETVVLRREGLEVRDPAHNDKPFTVVEGEPVEVAVEVHNAGPGDLISDFFTAVYAGSPPPRNNLRRPEEGEPFAGEPARDLRGLVQPAEERHLKSLYGRDLPDTPNKDDSRDTVFVTLRFTNVERDRMAAVRQLSAIVHASAIEALGEALNDAAYSVRAEAAQALGRLLQAAHVADADKQRIIDLFSTTGLASSDPVVRFLAAEALQYSDDPAVAEALLGLVLTDNDTSVRLVATRALAAMPDVSRETMLPALVARDPDVRIIAPRLFAIDEGEDVLRSLLFSPDDAVVREVLRATPQLLDTEHLIAAMQLPDGPARAEAARVLADRADPDAQEALLMALQDVYGPVRAAAARGLGELLADQQRPDPAVVEALVRVIEDEAADYVGVAAGETPEDPATAVITDKPTRAAAIAALAGVDTPEAVAAVRAALADTSPDVLSAVLATAEHTAFSNEYERLIAIMEDVNMPVPVRQAASLKFGEVYPTAEDAPEEVLDALVGLLNDPNETVKTTAAVVLIGMGDDRGDKVLRDQLRSKDDNIRREAAKLLAALPQERIDEIDGLKDEERDALEFLLEDVYRMGSLPVNFRFLVNALVFLGDQQKTVARLHEALTDPHPVMRAAAVLSLARLNDPAAEQAALQLLQDPNEFTRAAAAQAAGVLQLEAAADRLAELATTDPSGVVRDEAQSALNIVRRRG